jgi:hypothetical protein
MKPGHSAVPSLKKPGWTLTGYRGEQHDRVRSGRNDDLYQRKDAHPVLDRAAFALGLVEEGENKVAGPVSVDSEGVVGFSGMSKDVGP